MRRASRQFRLTAAWIEPPLPRSYIALAEHPGDIVRLASAKCDRNGQYHKADADRALPNMVDLRLTLAAAVRRSLPAN